MTQKIFLAGPISLSERVKRALSADKHLGDAEAAVLLGDVVRRLSRVYRDSEATHAPVLVPGPGAAAVEAMLGTLVPRDGNVLVVANGARGERAAEVLEAQGKRHTVARSHWLERFVILELRIRALSPWSSVTSWILTRTSGVIQSWSPK